LKLRGPEGCIDPDLWRGRTKSFGRRAKLEGDWVGERHLLSASLDGKIDGGRIEEIVAEHPQQVRRLLSEAQQALADEWLLPLDEVQLLGPVRAAKWKPGTGQLGDIAAELWEVGDRLRFLELSVLAEDDPLGHQQRLDEMVRRHSLEQGSGVLSDWPVRDVTSAGVEQPRTCGIMRFAQPHDRDGRPCLPTHHPRSRPPAPSWPTPIPRSQAKDCTCSATSPRSLTRVPAAAAATHWSRSMLWPPPRSAPAPG
jgi:hypothetical protein